MSLKAGAVRTSTAQQLHRLKQDILRSMPKNPLAQRAQLLTTLDDCQKVVSSELTDFAREMDIAVGEENFRLTDPAGI